MHRKLGIFSLVCAGTVLAAATPDPALPQGQAALGRLPLRFEENRGQWDPGIHYVARSAGASLQLTSRGPAFLVGNSRVALSLVHGAAVPVITAEEKMPAVTNYFVGARDQWHTGIANYARVRYQSVYPGVDVVYYGNQNQLEYDFVLAPGANPDAIRLNFGGDVKVSLTPAGDLTLTSESGEITQKAPVIYQDGRRIKGGYTMLARNQVGFRLERYDRTRALVIDPILVYCAYIGSSGNEKIVAIKMGPNGMLYLTGSTTTGEMQYIDGAYNNFSAGLTDLFLAIIDTRNGFQLKYFSYLGGASDDYPTALEVNAAGVAFLAGYTYSSNFPMAGNSVQSELPGLQQCGYVAAIDPAGYGGDSLIYSTYFGGTDGPTIVNGLALDAAGFVYLIGSTKASDLPIITDTAYAQVLYGKQDMFLTKLDLKAVTPLYSTYLGGELSDEGRSIAVGSDGRVYFAGVTVSKEFPLEGPGFRQTLNGGEDIVLGMMDMTKISTASLIYSTYLGGADIDEVRKISLDSKNNIVLTGFTLSDDFPVTADAVQRNPQGNTDVFVAVVNPNNPAGFLVYSTYFGGTQGDVAYDIKADANGNLNITGYTLSEDLYTVGAFQPFWGGGIDLFIATIKPGVPGRNGIIYCTYAGATGTYVPSALTLGDDGAVYIAGYGNIGLPITTSGFAGGLTDAFILATK
ncbi:MAG: SBBP repeat-containing protein [Candidatus Solibacter sp.]